MDFCETLRQYMQRSGMGYQRLAQVANLSAGTLRNWYRGTSNPRNPYDVVRLTNKLNLNWGEAETLLATVNAEWSLDELWKHASDKDKYWFQRWQPHLQATIVGRRRELAKVTTMIRSSNSRLITLTGLGGIGKTRLARQLAQDLAPYFEEGIYFVELASLETADSAYEAVLTRLINVLGIDIDTQFVPTSIEAQLLAYLQSKALLLILDNFEYLLSARSLLETILKNCRHVKFLITSREQLGLREYEQVYKLHGLEIPTEQALTVDDLSNYSAIMLLVEQIRKQKPDFTPTDTDIPALIQICQQTDGMPLALQLVATWANVLSLSEMAEDVTQLLHDQRSSASNHESIERVLTNSWKRLTVKEQNVLAALSLFRDQFNRQAAYSVGDTSLSIILSLSQKSMLETGRQQSTTWYRLHPLLRAFAQKRSKEVEQKKAESRYIQYYIKFLQEQEPILKQGKQLAALQRIEQDIANCQKAWQLAIAHHDWTSLRQALPALTLFYVLQGQFQQGMALGMPALSQISADDALVSLLLSWRVIACIQASKAPMADKIAEQALQLAYQSNDAEAIALAQQVNSWVIILNRQTKRLEEALEMCQQSAVYWQHRHESWMVLWSHLGWGHTLLLRGHYQAAQAQFNKSLALSQMLGDLAGQARILLDWGQLHQQANEFVSACEALECSLALWRQLNNVGGIAAVCLKLGHIFLRLGQREKAKAHATEALRLAQTFTYLDSEEKANKILAAC